MGDRSQFLKRLESWGAELAKAVLELKEPVMEIPARTLNQHYLGREGEDFEAGQREDTQAVSRLERGEALYADCAHVAPNS